MINLDEISPQACILDLDQDGPAMNYPIQEEPAKDDPMTESSVDIVAVLSSLLGILLLGVIVAGVSIYIVPRWTARRRRLRERAEGEWMLKER